MSTPDWIERERDRLHGEIEQCPEWGYCRETLLADLADLEETALSLQLEAERS